MESKHKDPNVYTNKLLNVKGPMHMLNWWQLFDIHMSQGNDMPYNPAPDTNLPITLTKKTTENVTPQSSSPYHMVPDPKLEYIQ